MTRPEFENALEGLRRELKAMGEHLGSDLAEIRAQTNTDYRVEFEIAEDSPSPAAA